MKIFNHIFKHHAWILVLLGVMTCSSSNLLGAAADMAAVKTTLADIDQEADWEEQISELNDFLSDVTNPTSLDAPTQQILGTLITKVFNGRLPLYKDASSTVDLSDLNLMLDVAQRSPMLSADQQKTVAGYQRATTVEQFIVQNKNTKEFAQQLSNIQSSLAAAGTTAFDPIIQGLFYQQLTAIYTTRTTQTPALQDRLNTLFTRAKTSTLIASTNTADLAAKIDTLSIESSLRKAAKDTVYANALSTTTPLQTQDQAKKFEEFTQNLNFTTLSQFFNTRDNRSPEEITALINLLTQASTTSLLTAAQQAQIKAMLASLATEKSIIDALSKTSFGDMLTAIQAATASGASSKPSTSAQKLYINALQKLFGMRPADNLQASNDLLALLNSALTSPLLADSDKAIIQGRITALQADIANALLKKQLQDALAITDPTARLAALQKFMTDNTGKTLSTDLQKALQDGINALVTSPSTDPVFLKNLAGFVGGLSNSGLLTPDFKAQMSTALTGINTNLTNATLGKELQDALAITDPAARLAALQKFMAANPNATMPSALQKTLQDGIDALIKSPSTDPAFLKNLAGFVGTLGNSGLLAPDFKTQMNTALTGINTNLTNAALGKELQDALAITDPTARLAALQKFMAANPNATIPSALQKTLQDGIDALIKSPSTDPVFLKNLAGFVGGLSNSGLLTPDFKTQMNTALTGINTNLTNATLGKELQDALVITDPAARLTALQKFMAANPNATMPSTLQKTLQDGINTLATNRTALDPAALDTLNKLVGGLNTSGLVSPEFKSQMGSLLPSITADLDKAILTKNLTDIAGLGDAKLQADALSKFVTANKDKALTPEQQKTLQDSLKKVVDSRSALDPAALGNLAKTVGDLGNNALLSSDFKAQMGFLIPAINADLDKAGLGKTLQDILAIQDPTARLAALQKFMADNAGKSLSPDLQKMLQDGINTLATNRAALDPAALDTLNKLVGGLNTSGLVSPEFKTQMGGLLPSITADLDKAGLTKGLADIGGLSDTKLQADALSKFVTANQGKTLTPEQQKLLQGSLKKVADGRSALDPAALGTLARTAAQAAAQPGLVGQEGVSLLNQTLLPGLKKDGDNADLLTGMQRALTETDPAKKIDLMNQVMASATDKDVTPATQAQLGQGLQSLIATKPTDPAVLGKLATMLNQAQSSTAIDLASQQAIKTALPGLAASTAIGANALSLAGATAGQTGGATPPRLQTASQLGLASLPGATGNTLAQQLQAALAIQDPAARLAALQAFMAANPNATLPAELQAVLQNGINSLLNTPSTNPLFLRNLAGFVGSLGTNSLLSPDFKTQLNTILPSITAKLTSVAGSTGLQRPAQLGGLPGATGSATQTQPTLSGLQLPGQRGLSGLPGAARQGAQGHQLSSGLKPIEQLVGGMPQPSPTGLPGARGTATQTQPALGGLQLPGQRGMTGLPGTTGQRAQGQQLSSGLKHIGQLSGMPQPSPTGSAGLPGTQGSATQTQPTLPGLQQSGQLSTLASSQDSAGQPHAVPGAASPDANDETLIREIQQAMTLPTLKDRMLGINAVLVKVGNRPLGAALQNAYAAVVQQLFTSRSAGPTATGTSTSTDHKKAIISKAKRASAKSRKTPATTQKKKKGKKKKKAQATPATDQSASAAAPATAPEAGKKKTKKKKRLNNG